MEEGVELKFYAVGADAYCPPSRTKNRMLVSICSFSTKVETRRLRPQRRTLVPRFFNLPQCC